MSELLKFKIKLNSFTNLYKVSKTLNVLILACFMTILFMWETWCLSG